MQFVRTLISSGAAKKWSNWQRRSKKFRERWLKLEGIKTTFPDGTVRAEGAREFQCLIENRRI